MMPIMLRITKLVLMIGFIITLVGCMHIPSANDPDGDGDARGMNHFPMHRNTHGRRTFVFDPNYRAFAVYNEQGKRINTGKSSGGAPFCQDIGRSCRTIVGTYTITRKGDEDCKSSRFPIETRGGAPMPYCMYFHAKGYAIHGSSDVPTSHNASHGCIRVTLCFNYNVISM